MGTTPFRRHKKTAKKLGMKAAIEALDSSGVHTDSIDALYLGNFIGAILERQETLAPLLADSLGLSDIPTMKTEGACASSGIAFKKGVEAIQSGRHDIVIAVGAETVTQADTSDFTQALITAADQRTEGNIGLTFPGFYALLHNRYAYEHGLTRDELSKVPLKNRRNGVQNPRARFQSEVTKANIEDSSLVADPLRRLDCCPPADGAAAAVLAASEIAPSFTDQPIPVLGSGHASGRGAAYRYEDLTTLDATVHAAEEAYSKANIEPEDVDLVELHDCFSIAEIGDSEDLGFFEKGQGAKAAAAGQTAIDGEIPINPSGGLLSKGHPIGATGIGQLYEVYLQMLNKHENQVEDVEIGLAHNLGGSGAVSTVTILGGVGSR